MWGVLFSETIDLLFRRVEPCSEPDNIPFGYATCFDYRNQIAEDMQDRSFALSIYWACVFFGCIIGALLNYWGFGNASERLNKRVRDSCFEALMRQEVAYFGENVAVIERRRCYDIAVFTDSIYLPFALTL